MKEIHLVDANEHVHIYTPLAKASLAILDLATVCPVMSVLSQRPFPWVDINLPGPFTWS